METDVNGRWDGIRNYQARNYINSMNAGDMALFYHSSCAEPGVYGEIKISSSSYQDPTAYDRSSPYFDAKKPTAWKSVDVSFVQAFKMPLLLPTIRTLPLGPCPLTNKGNRLSVIPLSESQYATLKNAALEGRTAASSPSPPPNNPDAGTAGATSKRRVDTSSLEHTDGGSKSKKKRK